VVDPPDDDDPCRPARSTQETNSEGATVDLIEQLDVILRDVKKVAAGVADGDFDRPSPCAAFQVRDLFDHMIGGASVAAPQLRGQGVPDMTAPSSDAERRTALTLALDDLADAIRTPGAFGRTVQLPFGEVPGAVLIRFLTVDGLVHTWDIATATGQTFEPSDELAGAVLASARELIGPAMRDGDTFAAAKRAPAGASNLQQLVAFTGRDI
jgi:uncharacterized protein (TIGR03086 family)